MRPLLRSSTSFLNILWPSSYMLPTGWSWPIRRVMTCCADTLEAASARADAIRIAEQRLIGVLLGGLPVFAARKTPPACADEYTSCQTGSATRRSPPGRTLQLELPGLADQAVAEAVVRLLGHQAVAGRFVDVARGLQAAVRPQHDLPVALLAREALAFVDEALADPEPAGGGLDVEHPELRDGRRLLDQEYRPDDPAVALRDPAPLALRVEVVDELRDDLRHQRLEPLVPAVLLRV